MTVGFNNGDLSTLATEVDPGSSGDPFTQFSINTTGEFIIGVDDTDSDSFKICQGSAIGTTDTFVMSPEGYRTLPLQSCFWAYLGSADTNVTGNGTTYALGSGTALTEVVDRNGDFTPGDGAGTAATFTAPVDGLYQLGMQVRSSGISTGGLYFLVINTTSYDMRSYEMDASTCKTSGDLMSVSHFVCVPLSASDTATFEIRITGDGSDDVDLSANSSTIYYTAVWGNLVG